MTTKNSLNLSRKTKQNKKKAQVSKEITATDGDYSEQLKAYLSEKTLNNAKLVGLVDIDKYKISES